MEYWSHDTHLLCETFLLLAGHFSWFASILLDPDFEDEINLSITSSSDFENKLLHAS